jgi:RNA polymerase sigma-70 factor (ECF subfamily)
MGTINACSPDIRIPNGTFHTEGRWLAESHRGINSWASRQPDWETTVGSCCSASEWHLVQEAIAGDQDALKKLFTRDKSRLYRVSLNLLRNEDDAADALQEALFKAYTSLRTFHGRSSFSTWLTRIVINKALMARRKKARRPEASLDEMLDGYAATLPRGMVDVQPDPEKIYVASEMKALFEEQLQRLPRRLQAAYQLYAVQGLSVAESSQALGIQACTLKSRVFRARRTLARGMRDSLEKAA